MGERPLTAVRLIEMGLALVLILLMSNALIGPLLDPEQTGGDKVPLLRLVWPPAYGVALLLVALRFRQMARFWFPALLFTLLVAWAFASTGWSIDPETSQRRAIAVAFTTLIGVYLAASFSGRALVELLAFAFFLMAVGSFVAGLAFPAFGVHDDIHVGAWRGLWYEKNQMGAVMVYGALSAAAAMVVSPHRRWLWALTLALCAVLVLLTTSKTSLLVLLLILGAMGALTLAGRGPAMAVFVLWGSVTGAALLGGVYYLAPELIFESIGKDPSLTGRTDIWEAVMRASRREPLGGYGYAAFWGEGSSQAKWIRHQLDWPAPNAHNGWLDLLAQLGQVGVLLFAVPFGLAAIAALTRLGRLGDGDWAAVFLAVFAFQILSESFVLVQNSLPWLLAVVAITRLLGPGPASPSLSPAPQRVRPRPAFA